MNKSDSISRLLAWIKEREAIRLRRAAGLPPPWTDDPILRAYSFCNVRREDDRTTCWIAEHWRAPHADDPDLWFAMAMARLVNWPPSLEAIGFPLPWEDTRDRFLSVARDCMTGGEQFYGGAYKIGGDNRVRAREKAEYQAADIFDPMWRRRANLRPRLEDTLGAFHARLMSVRGMGEFMAAQVVADIKYVAPLLDARDWMTFAASGPGSQRGLNRVFGRPVDAHWREDDWRYALRRLHDQITPLLERIGIERLHAQDLQNCLCEFDKMERARLGEGRPKRRFVPTGGGSTADEYAKTAGKSDVRRNII